MSTLAIAEIPEQIKALQVTCTAVADQANLARLEEATKLTLERGINNDHELRQANDLVRLVKSGASELKTQSDPVVSYFDKLHDLALATVKPFKTRFQTLEVSLKNLMTRYTLEAEARQRKQQQELEQAAEAERRRLAEEARKAMRNGDVTAAKEALAQVEATPTPVLATATPILEGTTFKRPWDVSIDDPIALLKEIVAGKAPLDFIKEWNIGLMKKEAARRGSSEPWAGVSAWQGLRPSVRK